jgi:uncharacterized MAPEG superfamily protein
MGAETALTIELRLLVYSVFICLILWIPYIMAEIQVRGLGRAVSYPTGEFKDLPDWAQRCQRAHMNLVENLAPFAALVLVAHVLDAGNAATALGAQLFFWARVVQTVVHIAGIPWLRTIAFAVGWIGNLIIFWQILT